MSHVLRVIGDQKVFNGKFKKGKSSPPPSKKGEIWPPKYPTNNNIQNFYCILILLLFQILVQFLILSIGMAMPSIGMGPIMGYRVRVDG